MLRTIKLCLVILIFDVLCVIILNFLMLRTIILCLVILIFDVLSVIMLGVSCHYAAFSYNQCFCAEVHNVECSCPLCYYA